MASAALRAVGRIDWALGGMVERPLADIEPPVLALLRVGAAQLWLMKVADHAAVSATVEAANIVHVSANGQLLPEVIAVLETIASLDLALATGHSSPQDSLLLARAARGLGIDRIVITHPLGDLDLPPAVQRELITLGAKEFDFL